MMIKMKNVWLLLFCTLSLWGLGSCRTADATNAGTATETTGSVAPDQVDIRGMIEMSRYRKGQIILAIEGRGPSPNSRYDRAYVLVLPTTQIIGQNGEAKHMSDLVQGIQVAATLRGRGQGEFEGIGIARKIWLEDYNYQP